MWLVCTDKLKIKYPGDLEDNRREYPENREANIECHIFIDLFSVQKRKKVHSSSIYYIKIITTLNFLNFMLNLRTLNQTFILDFREYILKVMQNIYIILATPSQAIYMSVP